VGSRRVYYVNSYRATPSEENAEWVLATSEYSGEFVGVVNRGEVYATQFHPEKSGAAGLRILQNFLEPGADRPDDQAETSAVTSRMHPQPKREV
jgi:glutamine amidotransferase/cyclase